MARDRTHAVVLDTNVVVSALLFAGGRLAALRTAWLAARFEPLISPAGAAELVRVLSYPKFKLSPLDRDELLHDYLPFCRTVRMPAELPRLPQCRDPKDQMFLELAAVGKASFLVTGDADLLALSTAFENRIVTPEEFLRRRVALDPR